VSLYRYERRSSPALLLVGVGLFLLIVLVAVAFQLSRGLPDPATTITLPQTSVLGQPKAPDLPPDGASIVAVDGLGTLGQNDPGQARPIASVTKMMTAYVLLKDHPLAPGESGPTVEITQADADRYWVMVSQDQSVQPVNPGGVLTELQLLQGMLIPSANNFAEIAAAWDAGSIEAFVDKMNAQAQALGMTQTVYDDPSGFSDNSVSTVGDQLILAREVMRDPVFAQTVGMSEVNLPAAGTVSNVNQLLGTAGIIGIKTGLTDAAGGNLMFAAEKEIAGQQIRVIGGVMHQADHQEAFDGTLGILNSLNNSLQVLRVVPAGQPVGQVDPAWGDAVDVVVAQDVTMLVWPGMTLETTVNYSPVKAGMKKGDNVGELVVKLGEQEQHVPLVLASDLPGAGFSYKLTNF
jgi:D-alanyl-D-alanine carboxypeptidase (penicillin-binding protein 5/6)